MAAATFAALGRMWFSILVLGSATFVSITFLSFAVDGGRLSTLLFWLGLAGENNVGAWWSGMLLLLAAVFALDGYAVPNAGPGERRAWLSLSAVLLILSFDEIGSLHEYLANIGIGYLAFLAIPLFVLTCYSLLQLARAGKGLRRPALVLVAFALLGTVPLLEYIQHSREWPNPVIYGARAALEEGVELAGILLLVAVASGNSRALLQANGVGVFEFARHRTLVLAAAASLAPVLVAATFVLLYPGGPADWLAAACYFGCALLVVKRVLESRDAATLPVVVLIAWYLTASVGSNAMKLVWDPVVLGTPISLRGLFVALLLASAAPILHRAGRRVHPLPYAAGALVALVGARWPAAQLLWCSLPVLAALHFYAVESRLAADVRVAGGTPGGWAVAGPV